MSSEKNCVQLEFPYVSSKFTLKSPVLLVNINKIMFSAGEVLYLA